MRTKRELKSRGTETTLINRERIINNKFELLKIQYEYSSTLVAFGLNLNKRIVFNLHKKQAKL